MVAAGPCHAEEVTPYPDCGRVPSESEVSAAKGAFEAGQVSFHEADYARTILFWEDAFRRDCTAIALLLNLARAYELAEQYKHSQVALETYLARNPDDPDRPAIERRIEHFEAKQREKLAAESKLAAATATKPATQADSPRQEPSSQATASAHRARQPVWPIVVTGIGTVATGVGLALGISGHIAVSDYLNGLCSTQNMAGEFACRPETTVNEDGDTVVTRTAQQVEADAQAAQNQRTLGVVVTGVGVATAAVGAVFWILGPPQKNEPTAGHLTPWLGPGLAGMSYSGAF